MSTDAKGNPSANDEKNGSYDSADLKLFEGFVDRLVNEVLTSGNYLLASKGQDLLKHQVAAALFNCAHSGERNFLRLRSDVMCLMFPQDVMD